MAAAGSFSIVINDYNVHFVYFNMETETVDGKSECEWKKREE